MGDSVEDEEEDDDDEIQPGKVEHRTRQHVTQTVRTIVRQ